MINRGGELHLPVMPLCYLELWHRIVWAKALKEYGGDTIKGSILDEKVSTINPRLERIKQFGLTWSWMALSPEAKAQELRLESGEDWL